MPHHGHPATPNVRSLSIQPGRSTIETTQQAIGREDVTCIPQETQLQVGPTPHRPLRVIADHQLLRYVSWQWDPQAIATDAMSLSWKKLGRVYLCPTVESFASSDQETNDRENTSNISDAPMAECDVVPIATATDPTPTAEDSTHSSTPRTRPRSESLTIESALEHDRLVTKQRRLEEAGIDTEAANVILDLARHYARQRYNRIQQRYIEWASTHRINPY